jgi:hypothetical protein
MVFSSRPYLCTNVVGDNGFDYALMTTIGDLHLGFGKIILGHGGFHFEMVPIMVLVIFLMH